MVDAQHRTVIAQIALTFEQKPASRRSSADRFSLPGGVESPASISPHACWFCIDRQTSLV